jgi:MFS superfamily sulfate permease-like transporter
MFWRDTAAMTNWLFASLRGYRPAFLPRDVVAGIMLAAIAIPGQLATARLAGMPPATGLYAFAAGSITFALFGANRYMSVAADSTIAPIFAGGLAAMAVAGSAHYATLTSLLALMVGGVLIAVGALRAGWLATLLSTPVITGFLAGIAIHIIVGELPTLLGLPPPRGQMLARLFSVGAHIREANLWSLAVGAFVLAMTVGAALISPRLPGALAGLLGAGFGYVLFRLDQHGVDVLGALSVRLPRLYIPGLPSVDELGHLVPLALIVAIVCIMQTSAVAATFPSDEGRSDDGNRNFAAVGIGSIVAGLTGSFAVDASPPSTAIVRESGGRSQLASLTAVGLMVLLAALAAGLTAYLPHAALSAVLVYIALRIFRVGEMIRIYRRGGSEILLVIASAALVVALPIQTGMLLAIVLSFLHNLYVVAQPRFEELGRVPGTTVWWPPGRADSGEHQPGVIVFAPGAPLNFTNAELIRGALRKLVATRQPPVKLLVIEASGMIDIDYTGSQALQQSIREWQDQGVTFALARLANERAQREAERSGLVETIGSRNVFRSVEEAIRTLAPPG